MTWVRVLLVAALASALPACLTHQYEISKEELQRVARLQPEDRGQRVRVVQQTGWDSDNVGQAPSFDEPAASDVCCEQGVHLDLHVSSGGGSRSGRGRSLAAPPRARPVAPRPVHAGAGVRRVAATPSVAEAHISRAPAAPRGVRASAGVRRVPATPSVGGTGISRVPARPSMASSGAPGGRASAAAASARRLPSRPRASSGSGANVARAVGSVGSGGGDGDAAVVVAVVAVVVATGAMAVAAPVEGGRYDGWMHLQSDQPVLVMPEQGRGYWVPLEDLDPSDANRAERAVLVDDGTVTKLGRAPLDRGGFAFSLEMGAVAPSTRYGLGDPAFQARLGLGVFVTEEFGLLLGGQFATADQDGTVFNGRTFLEGQYFPLKLGRLHLGLSGEGGYALLLHDAPGWTDRGSDPYLGASGLVQIDVTTRLAVVLRGGAAWLPRLTRVGEPSSSDRVLAPEGSLGLAVY